MVGASAFVVFSKNTVYSVFALIVAFINMGLITLLLRAEFLCFVVMIVYVGAVAVLFLFVVMMCGHEDAQKGSSFNRYLPIALIIFAILLVEVCLFAYFYKVLPSAPDLLAYPRFKNTDNVTSIGLLLYTHFMLNFQIAGYILLIAMIGAIVLTQGSKKSKTSSLLKKQSVRDQNYRSKENSLMMTSPKVGAGIQMKEVLKLYKMPELKD